MAAHFFKIRIVDARYEVDHVCADRPVLIQQFKRAQFFRFFLLAGIVSINNKIFGHTFAPLQDTSRIA